MRELWKAAASFPKNVHSFLVRDTPDNNFSSCIAAIKVFLASGTVQTITKTESGGCTISWGMRTLFHFLEMSVCVIVSIWYSSKRTVLLLFALVAFMFLFLWAFLTFSSAVARCNAAIKRWLSLSLSLSHTHTASASGGVLELSWVCEVDFIMTSHCWKRYENARFGTEASRP